jgi:hypothetical protein
MTLEMTKPLKEISTFRLKEQPIYKADNFICEPIVQKTWEPQWLTVLLQG